MLGLSRTGFEGTVRVLRREEQTGSCCGVTEAGNPFQAVNSADRIHLGARLHCRPRTQGSTCWGGQKRP